MDGLSRSRPNMPKKHSKYYFQDGNIILQVEDVLFKIHRYQIREGALGEDLPRPLTDQNEGLNSSNPIKIPQLSAKAFEALLDVLYHRGLVNAKELSSSTLITALDTADRYLMETLCGLIAQELQSHSRIYHSSLRSSFEILSCCLRHTSRFPRHFVLEQFTATCTCKERVSLTDLKKLGGEMMINVIQGREIVREGLVMTHRKIGDSVGPNHLPRPAIWSKFVAEIFPATRAEGGSTVGPVSKI